MKVLSVCEPWATLLVSGQKKFETRKWKTSHRGTIGIHASRTKVPAIASLCDHEPFKSALAKAGITQPNDFKYGYIIGLAEIVDCLVAEHVDDKDGLTDQERAFGDFRPSRWAWRLTNPRPLVSPFTYIGRIGLFEVHNDFFKGERQ